MLASPPGTGSEERWPSWVWVDLVEVRKGVAPRQEPQPELPPL